MAICEHLDIQATCISTLYTVVLRNVTKNINNINNAKMANNRHNMTTDKINYQK